MKKNSAFMLRSGNKPSIAKLMGVSPIKDEEIREKEKKVEDKEDEPVKPKYSDRELGEYAMELGYGPVKTPVGPVAKSYAEASGGSSKK